MGLDTTAVKELVERARREVDAGLLPSCQLALGYEGEVVELHTLGDATDENRYVIFSSTKAVVAATVWQLLAEGAFELEDRVGDLIPEFAENGKDQVTVEHVLLHTSGFPRAPLGPPAWHTRQGRLARFAKWRLNWEPGSKFEYHPTSAHWVLAELIERHDGEDFRAAVQRRVLDPLGLTRLRLGVSLEEQGDIAPVTHVGEPPTPDEFMAAIGVPGIDVGEVTEQAIMGFREPDALALGVPGGGAVSDAADLVLFYQALLHNREGLWDAEWLARGTSEIRNTFNDPMTGVPANRSIGLVIAGDDGKAGLRGMGHTVSPKAFGHDGAGGQIAWADPGSGLSFAYLTNGHDRHVIRQWRRTAGIASRAAVCATP